MEKKRSLHLWAGILLVCSTVLFMRIEARGVSEPVEAPAQGRSDIVRIDTLASFGRLELPPVTFLHDKHTAVLLKENKDCTTCHIEEGGKLSLTFKGTKDAGSAQIKDIYHSNCIGCHMEMAAAGKQTGPPDGLCRACHNAEKVASGSLEIGLDKVLHFRHVDSKDIASATADKDNCSRCHHEYDKQAKKIFYAKGKESTCRYCHLEKQKDDVKSMRQAAHLQCVQCHLDTANKGVKDTGPYICAGCHSTEGRAKIARKDMDVRAKLPNKEVPRLKREQPDAALIAFDSKVEGEGAVKPTLTNPVPFDHKAHENYNDTCRVCHHAAMDSCQKCHTLTGTKEGKFVNLREAMHLRASNHSCMGCHAKEEMETNCAGCHDHMNTSPRSNDITCRHCHMQLPEGAMPGGKTRVEDLVLTSKEKSSIAEVLLKGRNMKPGVYSIEDIPEKAIIKELGDQYEPAEMPHRKIVLTLLKGMQENPLGGYFHGVEGTMCQGCHHNSPASKQPPRCGNCHGKAFDVREPNRPGLQAALHQECMGCHKSMAIAKPAATACIECHKEKKK